MHHIIWMGHSSIWFFMSKSAPQINYSSEKMFPIVAIVLIFNGFYFTRDPGHLLTVVQSFSLTKQQEWK